MPTTGSHLLQDLETELLRNNITKVDLANELGRHRVTIHKWLGDLTPTRYETLKSAIDSIKNRRYAHGSIN